jgi:inositol oxygenase
MLYVLLGCQTQPGPVSAEYLYQVLVRNKCTLPAQGLYIIRYHSFYAHHQKHAYDHLCNEEV